MSSLIHLVFLKLSSHFTKSPFTQGRWRPGVLFFSFGRFVSFNTFLRADSIHPRRCAFAPTIRLFLGKYGSSFRLGIRRFCLPHKYDFDGQVSAAADFAISCSNIFKRSI
jgi:hypothetical protein